MANVSLKTFQAPSMQDALAAVKRELGKDAVILHTRSFKSGGFLGLGRKPVVEITASAGVGVLNPLDLRRGVVAPTNAPGAPARPSSALARAYGSSTPAASTAQPASRHAPSPPAPGAGLHRSRDAADFPASSVSSVRTPLVSAPAPRAVSPAEVRSARAAIANANEAGSSGLSSDLRQELAAIRTMVGQVLQSAAVASAAARSAARGSGGGVQGGDAVGVSGSTGGACAASLVPGIAMPEALLNHYLRLIQNDVARDIADEVVAAIRDELTPAEMRDDQIVRQAFLRRVESLIPVDAGLAPPAPCADGRPLTIAMIGPTGVGKTTTVAKLAAAYRLRHARRVGLITADTYRIAAVDQLRTYANIIGVPLAVAGSPEEMAAACESMRDMDAILIDTAGRSPNQPDQLDELARFLDAARPHRTNLVLASVASEATLCATVERFAPMKPAGLIFTKLDEAASFGVLLGVMRKAGTSLSFITTGQGVPDDIEPGRPDRLARLILAGSLRE